MVRLKTRYVIFQLRYPGPGTVVDLSEDNGISDILVESSATLSPKVLVSALRLSMTKNFGDDAIADSLTAFGIKYFSNKTSTGILRVHRDAIDKVLGAMFFVQTLEGRNVIWEAIGVSGSISKSERRAISRNKSMIKKIKSINGKMKYKDIDSVLGSFGGTDGDNDEL